MAASLVMNAITTAVPVATSAPFDSVEVIDPRRYVSLSDPRLKRVPKERRRYRAEAVELRPRGKLYDVWGEAIYQQIHVDMEPARDEIKAQCNGKSSEETTFHYNLFMAGRAAPGATEVLLTPCVWFFCGSRWCKRIVKKVMKDLKWLRSWGIGGCEAQVGGPIFLASGVNDQAFEDELHHLNLDLVNGIQLPNGFGAYLHLQVPSNWVPGDSAMGLICCSTLTRDETVVSRKLSRVGGVIYAKRGDGGPYVGDICLGVTTAHNLVDPWLKGSTTERDTSQDEEMDDTDSDSSEDDTSNDEELSDCSVRLHPQADIDHWLEQRRHPPYSPSSNTELSPSSSWYNVSGNMAGNFLGTAFGSLDEQSSDLNTTITGLAPVHVSDVLVFEIPGHMSLRNVYNTSSVQDAIAIDTFDNGIPNSLSMMGPSAEVFVIEDQTAAIGAELIPEIFQLYVRGQSLDTIRLKVSKPLRKCLVFSVAMRPLTDGIDT